MKKIEYWVDSDDGNVLLEHSLFFQNQNGASIGAVNVVAEIINDSGTVVAESHEFVSWPTKILRGSKKRIEICPIGVRGDLIEANADNCCILRVTVVPALPSTKRSRRASVTEKDSNLFVRSWALTKKPDNDPICFSARIYGRYWYSILTKDKKKRQEIIRKLDSVRPSIDERFVPFASLSRVDVEAWERDDGVVFQQYSYDVDVRLDVDLIPKFKSLLDQYDPVDGYVSWREYPWAGVIENHSGIGSLDEVELINDRYGADSRGEEGQSRLWEKMRSL